MENSQPKKKNAGLTALIALLLIITTVASCVGLYAWAKYITSQGGNATAQIAKWSFDLKLNSGASQAQDTAGPIDLADTIDFTHVKSGTIAPGTNGQFQVIVNTAGTEVDVLYEVTIALSNCPRNITFSRVDENNATTELSPGGASNTLSRTLTFSKYLHAKPTNENGRHVETITWNWPYSSDADANWDSRDNDDNGLQVTMNITATGTEMLEDQNAAAANTVQSQAQAGNIHVGDSVNYNPGSLTTTTASINLPEGASIEGSKLASVSLPNGTGLFGEINAASAGDWEVLDVNTQTGEVLIFPRTYSKTRLLLQGKSGYNNAITALNNVAEIYLNPEYATSARSLTVDDVNKRENKVGVNAPTGNAAEHKWDHRYGMNPTTLEITDTGSDSDTPEQTYTSTETTGYYNYSTNYFSGMNCWLASRCVILDSNSCYFYVRYLTGGNVSNNNHLFSVHGGGGTTANSHGDPVVPVVSLKSNIQMEKVNGVWMLNGDSSTYTAAVPITETGTPSISE